jgi:hypothetical protein
MVTQQVIEWIKERLKSRLRRRLGFKKINQTSRPYVHRFAIHR